MVLMFRIEIPLAKILFLSFLVTFFCLSSGQLRRLYGFCSLPHLFLRLFLCSSSPTIPKMLTGASFFHFLFPMSFFLINRARPRSWEIPLRSHFSSPSVPGFSNCCTSFFLHWVRGSFSISPFFLLFSPQLSCHVNFFSFGAATPLSNCPPSK